MNGVKNDNKNSKINEKLFLQVDQSELRPTVT